MTSTICFLNTFFTSWQEKENIAFKSWCIKSNCLSYDISRAESFCQLDEHLYWILFLDYNSQSYWIVSDRRVYALNILLTPNLMAFSKIDAIGGWYLIPHRALRYRAVFRSCLSVWSSIRRSVDKISYVAWHPTRPTLYPLFSSVIVTTAYQKSHNHFAPREADTHPLYFPVRLREWKFWFYCSSLLMPPTRQ